MTNLTYETAKKLKDAGFKQFGLTPWPISFENGATFDVEVYAPTLSELIDACGDDLFLLRRQHNPDLPPERATWWKAESKVTEQSTQAFAGLGETQPTTRKGVTPEEAVANLWLALNYRK